MLPQKKNPGILKILGFFFLCRLLFVGIGVGGLGGLLFLRREGLVRIRSRTVAGGEGAEAEQETRYLEAGFL